MLQTEVGELLSEHQPGGEGGHLHVTDLTHKRHRARSPGVRLKDIDHVIKDGVLHVHQSHYAQLDGDTSGVLVDGGKLLVRNGHRRDHTGGVTRMDSGILDVLHDCGHEGVGPVGQGIGLAFHGVFEEAIDENGALRGHIYRGRYVARQHLFVVDDLHPTSAQHVTGPGDHRVTDLFGYSLGLLHRGCHPCLRHRDSQALHHDTEAIPILGQIDGLGRGADDGHTGLLQFPGDVEGRLSAELDYDAFGPFFLIDGKDVFDGEGLEVQSVGGVVVG